MVKSNTLPCTPRRGQRLQMRATARRSGGARSHCLFDFNLGKIIRARYKSAWRLALVLLPLGEISAQVASHFLLSTAEGPIWLSDEGRGGVSSTHRQRSVSLIEDPPERNRKKDTNKFCVHTSKIYVVYVALIVLRPGFAEVLTGRYFDKTCTFFYKFGLRNES